MTFSRPLYDRLAGIYDRWLTGDESATPCLEFYVDELAGAPGPVLELGVGTGRISRALAAAGTAVLGLDVSSEMLDVARVALAEQRAALVCGRFEALPLAADSFDTVILPMRTVGHLVDPAVRTAAFAEAGRVLRAGGRFVLDHYQLDERWARAQDRKPRLMYAGPAHGLQDRALLIWDRYDYDFEARLLRCTVQMDEVGPTAAERSTMDVEFSFRWFGPEEIEKHASDAGLSIESCWGDFDRTPLRPDSDQMIFVLRKG
jgi:SAM-dependent methyltransferase